MAEPINAGDLVRVTEPNAAAQPETLKVDTLHSVRTGQDREFVASCLLPPYDNPNRFVNWPLSQLEKVPAEADPKGKKK